MPASEYWRAITRRWPIVLACLVVALALGYLASKPAPAPTVSPSTPPSFSASAILTMAGTSADPTGLSFDSMAYLANSGPVASMTSAALHGALSAAVIRSEVQFAPRDTLGLLQVSANAASPQQAASLADTSGNELIAYLNNLLRADWRSTARSDLQQINALAKAVTSLRSQPSSSVIQAELTQAQSQYVSDSVSYHQLLAAGPQHTVLAVLQPASASNATIVLPASSSASTHHSLIPTSRKKLLLLAGLVGLLVGIGLALARDRLDDKVRSREQAEKVFGLPVLAELPRVSSGRRGLVLLNDPLSAAAESYRMLQTVITLGSASGKGASHATRRQVILLTSPYELDGKEQVMANLAASFAEAGRSVAVLAMDSFDRSLPALLAGARAAGGGGAATTVGTLPLGTVIDGVSLVLDGIVPGIGNGRSERHLRAVSEARGAAEVVLVDTPPVLLTHDASELSSVADAVVVMCPVGQVKRAEATRAVDTLRRVGAPLDGVVLVEGEPAWRRLRRLLRSEAPSARHLHDTRSTRSPAVAAPAEIGAADSITAVDVGS